jgi:hypothetical protein
MGCYRCSWKDVPLVYHYVFANARLDPNHEDLLWERHLEIKNQIIEVHSELAQKKWVQEQLAVLHEHLEECNALVAAMMAAAKPEREENSPMVPQEDDSSVFESRAKGSDLYVHMSKKDSLDTDILAGYTADKIFSKIITKPGDHLDFTVQDNYIWRHNKGNKEVLYVPVTPSRGGSLYGCIIEQAHFIVGHFGTHCTAKYV